MDQKQKPAWVVWVGVAFLAAVIILSIISPSLWRGAAPGVPQKTGPQPTYAPQGQLIPGFPKELILDSAARVGNSYSINYSASGNQYTAAWNSSSSVAALFNQYKTYLPANGWVVPAGSARSGKYGASLFATNANPASVVNISIVPAASGNGAQVTISYVAK